MGENKDRKERYRKLLDASSSSILILDGATGTMLQSEAVSKALLAGQEGNHEMVSLLLPEKIYEIHRAYLEAGAHIIETNTFNANVLSQEVYGKSGEVYNMNLRSAEIACRAAEEAEAETGIPRFVAGSVGPTKKSASLPPRVEDPSYRDVTFQDLEAGYIPQIKGLIEGGADILLFETFFDALNCKAALSAGRKIMEETGISLPIMVSATISDTSGRTLTGQTLTAFYWAVEPFGLFSFGVNCSFGPSALFEPVKSLAPVISCRLSIHPNAGLPGPDGSYTLNDEQMLKELQPFLSENLVHILGGCCGTTPDHIQRIQKAAAGMKPPPLNTGKQSQLYLSGLEELEIPAENHEFIFVSEGLNVSGSKRFARIVSEGAWDKAMEIAQRQTEAGAKIIDVCMDDALTDGSSAMTAFLRRLIAEPGPSKLPVMIDSSSWETIEAGLQNIPGKGIVNSVSLKEGEQTLLSLAKKIRSYGAALIVMLFDEQGQADTYDRKTAIARRAYQLLTEQADIPPTEIIIDPNVLAAGTGIDANERYAKDFIDATAWIKANLPGVRVIGGITNLSFAFRGSRLVRDAMHTVFLRHAVEAGLDMGIIDPRSLQYTVDDFPSDLIELVEDLVLCRKEYAGERLAEEAERFRDRGKQPGRKIEDMHWRSQPAGSRLAYSIQNGIITHLSEDLQEALEESDSAVEIIEGPLMQGMDAVGKLFGEGKVFLPQVVKSARAMKEAASFLQPYIERETSESVSAGKILLATVHGDVHDIGKNLAAVVLRCSRYEVIDLGIMVPPEQIIEGIKVHKPDILGLSGLITPSLEEMIRTLRSVEEAGCRLPVLIGGAATSAEFVETKIQPAYSKPVIHVKDASRASQAAGSLLAPSADTVQQHKRLNAQVSLLPLEAARKKTPVRLAKPSPAPSVEGIIQPEIPSLSEIEPFMNWNMLLAAWRTPPGEKESESLLEEARLIFEACSEKEEFLPKGVVGLFPVRRFGDDVVVYHPEAQKHTKEAPVQEVPIGVLHFLRRQSADRPPLSLADFIVSSAEGIDNSAGDYLGVFAVTAGYAWRSRAEQLRLEGDDYQALLTEFIADRVAEAYSEFLHMQVRRHWWGYAQNEQLSFEQMLSNAHQGIRPAVGYPSCPDHSEKSTVCTMLNAQHTLGISLTATQAMNPPASICGYYFASPEASYISLGKIGEDQLEDYAARKGWTLDEARRWLSSWVAEDYRFEGKDGP